MSVHHNYLNRNRNDLQRQSIFSNTLQDLMATMYWFENKKYISKSSIEINTKWIYPHKFYFILILWAVEPYDVLLNNNAADVSHMNHNQSLSAQNLALRPYLLRLLYVFDIQNDIGLSIEL